MENLWREFLCPKVKNQSPRNTKIFILVICNILVIGCVNILTSACTQVILDFVALSSFENVTMFYSILLKIIR